mmetsp:Transcript_14772/g.43140  ORF Transcript_14772/g.43140 Transcript_14772/m.43140 type:complete len:350 (-) Transcript_14772:353-1402(-)
MENSHRGLFVATLAIVAGVSFAFAFQSRRVDRIRDEGDRQSSAGFNEAKAASHVSVAFLGNSIIYYNDTPRFLAYLRNAAAGGGMPVITQDSCLRGGASLVSLLTDGNGMGVKFGTPNSERPDGTHDIGAPTVEALLAAEDNKGRDVKWDFVVMNDYTQAPARTELRRASLDALVRDYVPMFLSTGVTPVFLVTAAYCEPVNNSEDLGGVEEFTAKLMEGYEEYAAVVGKLLPASQRPVVAPVGLAFLHVYREDRDMWRKLFHTDHFHPSPHGSYLQACVLHRCIFGELPPEEMVLSSGAGPGELWDRAKARVMQPAGTPPLQRPTAQEAAYLREVAGRVYESYIGNTK